jgi:hypothetical protein
LALHPFPPPHENGVHILLGWGVFLDHHVLDIVAAIGLA